MAARPRLLVVASRPTLNETSGGLITSDREVSVRTDRISSQTAVQTFPCSRVLNSADALHDAVVVPLVEALLSRRLSTEEAAIFTLGDARECEAVLVSSILRCSRA